MPQTRPTVLSAAFSRPKSLPESFAPAHYRFLLRLNRSSRACLHLSTPAGVAFIPSWPQFCFECPTRAFEAEVKRAINPKILTPEPPV